MCLAVPGQVTRIVRDETLARTAAVSFGGIVREVNLTFVPEAEVGDYVLTHVGFAITKVDEAEANRVFEYLRELGEVEESLGEDTAQAEGDDALH